MSVRTFDVLDWLRGVISAHHDTISKRGGHALVLAAALPERARWKELIAEVLKTDDGVLIDATECGRGVACGDVESAAPDLITEISRILDEFNGSEGTDLRLEIKAGWAEIVSSQDYESINAAQRAMREVLTATCADSLRSADLTLLLYAEDALDEQWQASIWDVLMRLTTLLGSASRATTAIVAGDAVINYDVHCTGNPSLRDRLVNGGGLQSRNSWETSARPIIDLQSHSRESLPLFVLFLGAGASTASGLPTGDTLRNEALTRALGSAVDWTNFDTAARQWWAVLEAVDGLSEVEKTEGQDVFVRDLTLERVIAHEQLRENQIFSSTLADFSDRHDRVIEALHAKRKAGELDADPLRRMLLAQQRFVIVTVNFDQLIEARLEPDQFHSFVSEEELANFPTYLETYASSGGAVPVLKLHGDITQHESIVANIDETLAGLSLARQNALNALIDRVASQRMRPWWYVGYSMRDRDLANTWNEARMASFLEYWVSPFMDPVVKRFIDEHRSRTWSSSRLPATASQRHISLTSSDFYKLMDLHLTSHWAPTI
jgi:hypothetical protein